jgi:hypothetical protein
MATAKRSLAERPSLTKRTDRAQKQTGQPLAVLAPAERQDLERCEEVITTKLVAFLEVGRALLKIKQARLYREHYNSFEIYCERRWGFNRSHAYRLVDAAEVCAKMSPMGDISLPENERQVRPLCGLTPEAAKEAWKRAVERAGKGPITGSLVKLVAAEVRGPAGTAPESTQDWQLRIEPLLKEALHLLKHGEKAALDRVIQRISLLLLVGERNREQQE